MSKQGLVNSISFLLLSMWRSSIPRPFGKSTFLNGFPYLLKWTRGACAAMQRLCRTGAKPVGVVCLLGALSGCPSVFDPGDVEGPEDGNQNQSLTSPKGKTSGEPNDTFENAIVAVFDGAAAAKLQGTISRRGDIDVYWLGELPSGDLLNVDVATDDSVLDASIAVFDDQQRLTFVNDDRGGDSGRLLDPLVAWIVRHEGEPYYLVISNSAFAASNQFTGSYTIEVERLPGFAVPEPRPQILLLDFDGAQINSPVLGQFTLEPFDGQHIAAAYADQTEFLKQRIIDTVEQNFENFDVLIVTSDDPPPPVEMTSTVYFGGFNANAFGLAESVDLYNADFCDDAVIYTESFSPSVFSFLPTAAEMGLAIGNIASHEAGHLLGLNHTDDDRDLMDARSPADAFVQDQEFMLAPLSEDIIPIGWQDGYLLLQETTGLRPDF